MCGFRFAFEGVLQAIYGFNREQLDCADEKSICMFRNPEDMLKELDVEDAKFYIDFSVLCLMFLLLRIACYVVLRWRIKVH